MTILLRNDPFMTIMTKNAAILGLIFRIAFFNCCHSVEMKNVLHKQSWPSFLITELKWHPIFRILYNFINLDNKCAKSPDYVIIGYT